MAKRRVEAELAMMVGMRGMSESYKDITTLTTAVTALQDAVKACNRILAEQGQEANVEMKNFEVLGHVMRVSAEARGATLDQYVESITLLKDLETQNRKINSLSEDEIELFKESCKIQDIAIIKLEELIKQKPELNDLLKDELEILVKNRDATSGLVESIQDQAKATDELKTALKQFPLQIMSDIFGGAIGALGDKTGMINAFSNAFAKMSSVLKPFKNWAKSMISIDGALFRKGSADKFKKALSILNKFTKGTKEASEAMAGGGGGAAGAGAGGGAAGAARTLGGRMGALRGALGSVMASLGGFTVALIAALPVIIAFTAAIAALVVGLYAMIEAFKAFVTTQERFRETGYRSTGTINELVRASADLSESLGLTMDEAANSIAALTNAGLATRVFHNEVELANGTVLRGQEVLAYMAEAHAMYTNATGASADVTARFQVAMTSLGWSADRTNSVLTAAAVTARDAGLTGADLDIVIGRLTDRFGVLNGVLDDTQIQKYREGMLGVAAAARIAGVDVGTAMETAEQALMLGTDLNALARQSAEGLAAVQSGDALMAQAEAFARFNEIRDEAVEGITNFDEINRIDADLRRSFGITEAQFRAMQEAHRLISVPGARAEAESQQSMLQMYEESMGTLQRQLQQILAPILARLVKILEPLVIWVGEFFDSMQDGAMGSEEALGPLSVIMGDVADLFKYWAERAAKFWEDHEAGFKAIGAGLYILMRAAFPVIKVLIRVGEVIARFIMLPFRLFSFLVKQLVDDISFMDWLDRINRAAEWFGDKWDAVCDGISGAIEWMGWLGDAIMWVKDLLFGSSMLHIKESVEEDIIPALRAMIAVIYEVANAFNAVRTAKNMAVEGFKMVVEHPEVLWGDYSGVEAEAAVSAQGTAYQATMAEMEMSPEEYMANVTAEYDRMRSQGLAAEVAEELTTPDNVRKVGGAVDTVNTVQVSNELANQFGLALEELVYMNRRLAQIIEVSQTIDPNNERAADHLETIAEQIITSEILPIRSTGGFGEHTSRGWR